MQTRSSLQRRSNSESSDRVVAHIKPRPWGDETHEQPKTVQRQTSGFDFKNADWFSHDPGPRSPVRVFNTIQAKLKVGAPNDQYEQEADRVAEQVMSTPDSAVQQTLQREAMPEEEEELQMKPLAATITPLVQREAMPEEEEEIQTKSLGNSIQREVLPEEEEGIQTKSLGNSIQREVMSEEEEEEVQTKALGDSIQRETMPEEEEEIQTKRSPDAGFQAGNNLESRLNSSQGGGSPLPDDVRTFMEPRFGADFSQVRVHTGNEAVQMNQDLNAQAFTHKQDVYFGAGKAPANDPLTAHELTHVVQQTGAIQARPNLDVSTVQMKCSTCDREEKVQRVFNLSTAFQPSNQEMKGDVNIQRVKAEPELKELRCTDPDYAHDEKLIACLEDRDRLRPGERDKPGEEGPVTKIQRGLKANLTEEELKKEGINLTIDGVYGQNTGQAVILFKKKHKLGSEEFPDVGPGTIRRLNELCNSTGTPPETEPPKKGSEQYEVEIKAWIPHEKVVDPEETPRGIISCPSGVDFPSIFTSNYLGDSHSEYEGSFRVSCLIQFSWDGQKISDITHKQEFGLTQRTFSCETASGDILNKDTEVGRQTKFTDGGLDGDSRSFFLTVNATDPLIILQALTPPIRSLLTGTFNDDRTLHLVAQTTKFPNHGFRVIRNGATIIQEVTNDASSVEALGPAGLKNLFSGLTDFSNVVVRNPLWK